MTVIEDNQTILLLSLLAAVTDPSLDGRGGFFDLPSPLSASACDAESVMGESRLSHHPDDASQGAGSLSRSGCPGARGPLLAPCHPRPGFQVD